MAASNKEWPDPIGDAAYIGPLGDYVREIAPHSEGDPAAILVQRLTAFGNSVGRKPHFTLEATPHHCNLNVMIVGNTASARKGTSLGRAFDLIATADTWWGDRNRGEGGLSTAEGLIRAVADDPKDPEADKRLFAPMGEFAETLQKMSRDGNTLSETIRQAWDGTTLKIRTRSDPLTATDAHVSLIGHITEADLTDQLTSAHVANGFANRFLWVVARRARKLPFGGTLSAREMPEIVASVRAAIEWGQLKPREIKMSGRLAGQWARLYCDDLTYEGDPQEDILQRAAPQVRRLATVYAVSEKSHQVERRHLNAALAVWTYSEASVRYVFGEAPRLGLPGLIERLLATGEWTAHAKFTVAASKEKLGDAKRVGEALDIAVSQKWVERREVPTTGRTRREYRRLLT
jgi:hypothetical protein